MATWNQGCSNTAGATTAYWTSGDYLWLAQKIPIWANATLWNGSIYMSGSNSAMHGISDALNDNVNAINWLVGPNNTTVSTGWNTLTRTAINVSQGLDRYQIVRLYNPNSSSYTGFPYQSPDQNCDRSQYYNWRTTTSSWGLYSKDLLLRNQVIYQDPEIQWQNSYGNPIPLYIYEDTPVGNCTGYQNFYLKNISNGPAKGSISISSQAHFDVYTGIGVYGDDWQPFLPGDTVQFRVRFCPSSTGYKTATVTATCTPNCTNQTLSLEGEGYEDYYVHADINFTQSTFYTGPFPPNSYEYIVELGVRNRGNTAGYLYARFYEYPNTTDENLIDEKVCWSTGGMNTCIVDFDATTPSTTGSWPVGVKVRGADQSWPAWGALGTAMWEA